MLRISVNTDSHSNTLKLEGKIAGPWVNELRRAWGAFATDSEASPVVLDLSGVTFIDSEGEKLLEWLFHQGAQLSGGPLMTKYIVDKVTHAR